MILDELDPAVLEQLTERERQELIAAAEGLQGSALQTHMAAAHPTMRVPSPQRLPRLNLQPGQMFSYSTQGPGRFNPDTDIAVGTPTGETVYAPENAQNISMVQGPAGPTEAEQSAARNEEAQRQAFTQMMSGIPLKNFKDAETATKMAILFQAHQQQQRLIRQGKSSDEAMRMTMPMFMAAGVPTTGASRMFAGNANRFMNVGGRLYRTDSLTGEAIPVTEPAGVSADTAARIASAERTRGVVTPTAALNVVSDPMKWAFAQNALGPDATNLVNIARSGLAPQAGTVEQPSEQEKVGPLTSDIARKFLKAAGGDKERARKLARDAGYTF